MEEDKFEKLMAELQTTRREMDVKLTSSIAEVKREVSSVQERTAKDLQRKLNRPSYRFRGKSKEMQHSFNLEVEDSISSARQELERMVASVNAEERSTLEKAAEHLEEGASALKTRQKLIKIADRSDFGWGVAHHYQTDPLADNSDDEKELRRTDKAARRGFEEKETYYRKPRGGKS